MKTYKELCWLKAGQVWSWSGSDCGAVAVRGYKCCLMIRALAFLRFTFVIFWSGRFLGISCITENMTHHKWFLKPHKNINENKNRLKEARFWFCTWLNWSSGSGFGSRGLRLCTLEINNTTQVIQFLSGDVTSEITQLILIWSSTRASNCDEWWMDEAFVR